MPAAFAESLPADIRGEAAFRDIKDLGSLATSYLAAQRMVGDPTKYAKLPSGPEDKAGWDGLFNKLGRPESADKYTLQSGSGVTVDPVFQKAYQGWAHEAGLTQAQAQTLMSKWNENAASVLGQQATARTQMADTAVAALKTEWGAAYDANLTMARQAVDHYGGAKLQAELDQFGIGNSPELTKVLAKIGAGLKEDGMIGKGSGGVGETMSPAEATQQIAALQLDPVYRAAAMDARHPQHAAMQARMTMLYGFKAARAA